MRCRLAAGTVGLGCAGLMMMVLVTPAAANRGSPAGRMAGQDMAADCEQAAMDTPEGPGGLKLTTDVPDGATVGPGDDIAVKLTWDPEAWSGRDLDAALACVKVKRSLDPDLSAGERPSANDGVFAYVVHVPENIRPGCDVCVQGFLTGMGDDGDPQQVTGDRRCFMSGPPRPPTRPPATPATVPPPVPATTPTTAAPPAPTEVGGIQASKPAPPPLQPAPAAPAPALAPAAELPRTGSPVTQLATTGGGLTLTLGGLSVIGGAGRRRRRRVGA